MKYFKKIVRYAYPYKRFAFLNIFFNIFYALFSALSFVVLMPFLLNGMAHFQMVINLSEIDTFASKKKKLANFPNSITVQNNTMLVRNGTLKLLK